MSKGKNVEINWEKRRKYHVERQKCRKGNVERENIEIGMLKGCMNVNLRKEICCLSDAINMFICGLDF